MQDKVRKQIVEAFGEQFKELVKGFMEQVMLGERDI